MKFIKYIEEAEGGWSWNENENDAWFDLLVKGKAVTCKSAQQAKKDYPILLKQGLVYIDSFGSGKTVALRLTDEGEKLAKGKYKHKGRG
jgi:hypothetical protein